MAAKSDETLSDIHLASALRIAITRFTRRLRAERTDINRLTMSQISALSALSQRGPLSPSALADFERVQPPSMTRIIAALEERGLVERKPHASDGRVSVIALSKIGDKLLAENREHRNAWLSLTLGQLTEDERSILRAATPILQRLSEQ